MTDNAQAWTVYNSLMVDPLTHTVYVILYEEQKRDD